MIGRVRFFDTTRNFGFISITDESELIVGDWFFHGRDVIGAPVNRGDTVDFLLSDSQSPHTDNLECVEVVLVKQARANIKPAGMVDVSPSESTDIVTLTP